MWLGFDHCEIRICKRALGDFHPHLSLFVEVVSTEVQIGVVTDSSHLRAKPRALAVRSTICRDGLSAPASSSNLFNHFIKSSLIPLLRHFHP